MQGDRIDGLKQAMLLLASNSVAPADHYARFQNREEVGIITFSDQPAPTRKFPMGSTPDQNAKARSDITDFVKSLNADGSTAIYASLMQALIELSKERSAHKDPRYYTVLLMTDGANNRHPSAGEFRSWYRGQGDAVRGIRVFPILFGEGSQSDLGEIAEMTGGRLFDSSSRSLAAVFKEIRSYQ
jgi:Ca-activated chloride channel family protein